MTDQTSNDSGSRRLRREEERRRLAMEQGTALPSGPERSRRDDRSPLDSPVERSWQDDAPRVSPERGWRDDPPPMVRPQQPTLSRRELRERAAGGEGRPVEDRPPFDDSRAMRRLAEPGVPGERPRTSAPDRLDRPDLAPAPSERPLSRRELRERAEGTSGDSGIYRSRPEEVREPEPTRPAYQGGYADDRGESLGRRAAQGRSPDAPVGRYETPGGRDEGPRDGSLGAPPARRDRGHRADLSQPDARPREERAPDARPAGGREYGEVQDRRDGPLNYQAPREEASRYEAPREDAPRYEAPRDDALRYEAPRDDAPRYEASRYEAASPVLGPLEAPARHHSNGSEQGPASHQGSARPEQPEQPEQPKQPEQPEQPSTAGPPEQKPVDEGSPPDTPEAEKDTEPDPPARISPQARAAAIKAQAARAQAEREDATREHYERLQSRRTAQQAAGAQQTAGAQAAQNTPPVQQPGQPPAAMWGQRQDSNGAPPVAGAEPAGSADRPPVRRVVLPASMSAGTSPTDVPVLGQWQSQPQQYQAATQQPQPQPQQAPQQYQAAPPHQQPHQVPQQPQQYQAAPPQQYQAAPPQQYQGIPQSGPMPTNGQPFATVSMAAQTATAPARPATGGTFPPNTDGSGPLPRWGSVGGSGAWSPTPAYVPNGQAPAGAVTGAPQPEDDDGDSERKHPYTWLHMIVLVLVAFVLGMLIFMLVIKDASENGAAAEVIEGSLAQITEPVGT